MKLTLYHFPGACSLAPLVALEEAGLPYDCTFVDLTGDRSEYIKINPAGKVPALTIDGTLLTENAAILYYIAGCVPARKLFPEGLDDASQCLSFMAWLSSTVHALRGQIFRPMKFTPDADAQAKIVEAGRPKMWDALLELDRRLGDQPWFGGHNFGVADAYAIVFYDCGLRDKYPMAELRGFTEWKNRMLARPGVRAALLHNSGPLSEEI